MFSFPKPDYAGNGLVNLISGIRLACGDDGVHYPACPALDINAMMQSQHVMLLVIDGLGYDYLQQRSGSFLQRHCQQRISSVFPTTTSAAITTVMSGEAPQQHGLTGWFMHLKELGAVTAILPFTSRVGNMSFHRHNVDIKQVVDVAGYYGKLQRDVYIISERRLINSPFSHCFTSEVNNLGYEDLSGCVKQIKKVSEQEQRTFTYAYWAQLDHDSHVYGVNSSETSQHFVELDKAMEQLANELANSNTHLIITADHGLLDTAPDRLIQLEQHPQLQAMLTQPLCGEPRAAYCYLKPGYDAAFEQYVANHLSHACEAWPSSKLLEMGLFGEGECHSKLADRIGDYTLLMKSNYVIKDRLPGEKCFNQIGVHGGLSEEELYVPLIQLKF